MQDTFILFFSLKYYSVSKSLGTCTFVIKKNVHQTVLFFAKITITGVYYTIIIYCYIFTNDVTVRVMLETDTFYFLIKALSRCVLKCNTEPTPTQRWAHTLIKVMNKKYSVHFSPVIFLFNITVFLTVSMLDNFDINIMTYTF